MSEVVTIIEPATQVIEIKTGTQGPMGPQGPVGPSMAISDAMDNRLVMAGDGLYVPEIQIDPLAYYVLARS